MHKQDNPIECPGCTSPFPTASALVQHIEQDLCPGHTKADLELSILTSQVALDKAASAGGTVPANAGVRVLNHVDTSVIDSEGLGGLTNVAQRHAALAKSEKERTFEESKQMAKLEAETWSPYDRAFCCPEFKCKKKFNNVAALWQHLGTDVHRAKNFRCPGCHSKFIFHLISNSSLCVSFFTPIFISQH